MPNSPIDSEPLTLHKLFNDHPRLRVPEFQRNYVWRTAPNTELPRFWDDLTGLWDGDGGAPLFLGAVVLHQTTAGGFATPDEYDIVDGQQRLITLYLCLVAVAEAFQDAGDIASAKNIEQQYLLLQLSQYQDQPQILPAFHDTAQFNDIVLTLNQPKPQIQVGVGKSEERLAEAWRWIRKKVRDYAADRTAEYGLSLGNLSALQEKLVGQTHLVVIRVFDKATAHQVFERLNKGGKPLEDIDLVRNMVFSTLSASTPQQGAAFYGADWDPFEEALKDRAKDYWYPLALIRNDKATKVGAYTSLQHWWLDQQFTQGYTGHRLASMIMDDLTEYLEPFQAITGIKQPAGLGTDEWRALRRLHRAEVPIMTYRFFMELVKARVDGQVGRADFIMFCEIVESAIARRVLRGMEMNAFQQAFKDAWKPGLTGQDLWALLADKLKLGTDADLRQGVMSAELYKMKRCRWVLTEFERWIPDGNKLLPTQSDEFHLDHVLPERWNPDAWPGVTTEEHQLLRHTWGNLALLTPKQNIAKSAKDYRAARERLVKPGAMPFRSTGELLSHNPAWNADRIKGRSDFLADWAIMRWPSTIGGFRDPERAKRLAAAD